MAAVETSVPTEGVLVVTIDRPDSEYLQRLKISANVTNLADISGVSTIVVTGSSGGYQAYPIAPRMFFVTVAAGL